MDQESRKQWQLAHPGTNIKTWDDLSKFLDTRSRALETGSLKVSSPENAKAQSSEKQAQVYHMSAACSEICGDPHNLHACPEFKKKSVSDRLHFVRSKNLCFNCLQGGHTVGEYQSKYTCRECKLKHHSLLYRERKPAPQAGNGSMNTNPISNDQRKCPDSEDSTAASAVITGLSNAGNVPTTVLLSTAMIQAKFKDGNLHDMRALLDSGSQASFITEYKALSLKLMIQKSHVLVNTLGATQVQSPKELICGNYLPDLCQSSHNSKNNWLYDLSPCGCFSNASHTQC